MPAFGNATAFLRAREDLQGWIGCNQYVADNAVCAMAKIWNAPWALIELVWH